MNQQYTYRLTTKGRSVGRQGGNVPAPLRRLTKLEIHSMYPSLSPFVAPFRALFTQQTG